MNAYKIFTPEEAKKLCKGAREWKPGEAARGIDKWNDEAEAPKEVGERVMASPIIGSNFIDLVSPPKLSRYREGGGYALHTDAASQFGVRSDLACTLFLNDGYEGGELVVGGHEVKLPPGDAIVYECWKPHRVNPVTKGERIAAIFWMQSYIRSSEQRELLSMLRGAIVDSEGDQFAVLGSIHEKLVKMWWN